MEVIVRLAECIFKTIDRTLNKLSIAKNMTEQNSKKEVVHRTKQFCDVIYARANVFGMSGMREELTKLVVVRMKSLGYEKPTEPKKVNDTASKITFTKYITPHLEDNEQVAIEMIKHTTCTSICFRYALGGIDFEEGWKYRGRKSMRRSFFWISSERKKGKHNKLENRKHSRLLADIKETTMNRYLFNIVLVGEGSNEQEAWFRACESFSEDYGPVPKSWSEESEEGEVYRTSEDYNSPCSNGIKAVFDGTEETIFALYQDDGYDAKPKEVFPQDGRTFPQNGLMIFANYDKYSSFIVKLKNNPSRRKNPRITRKFTTNYKLLQTGDFEAASLMED